MQDLRYARASSVVDAVRLLTDGGPTGRILAGGTDVIVQARERTREISLFVDVKHVPETMEIHSTNGSGLSIGAATPCYRIYNDVDVQRDYPALVDATSLIGGTAIQGRASLGGNLCNSSPAADGVPPLIALGATAVIAGPSGERRVPVEEFSTGPGQNVLDIGELVISLEVPTPQPSSGVRFLRFIPRNEMDIAVVNVASALRFDGDTVTEARIVVGAAAPTTLLVEEAAQALVGQPLSDETIANAAAAARAAVRPIDDMRGSVKQRRHLAGVLTKRTLQDAARRARGEEVTSHP